MIKIFLVWSFIIIFYYYNKNKNNKENFESSSNIPILVITDKKYFNDQKKLLNKIGFNNVNLINPVYIKDTKMYCKNIKVSRGELGCSYAHLNALKKVIKLNKSCIIFEKDWTYTISNNELKKEILKYYNLHKKDNITYLGYCKSKYTNDYDCTHGYIISPKKAKEILKNKNKLCFDAIDTFYYKYYCKNNECTKVPNKYNQNKKLFGSGLIFQDRNKYTGMRNANNQKTELFY
jgi:GR25 family glycosyltransferase involved in LPS biosynthesis